MKVTTGTVGSVFVAIAVLLSGCGGQPPGPAGSPTPTAPVVGDDSGAIEGTISNDELDPIRNAQVALQSGVADPALTNEDGRFVFSEVPPGRHVVFVTALGYSSEARSVDVIAGEVSQVSVQLDPISPDEPFSSTEIKEGYIACGSGAGQSEVGGFTQVACGSQDPNQKFLFNYTFTDDLKGILFEMTWKPTQALSTDLVLNVEKDGCGVTCGDADTFAQVQGCCYIRIALPVEDMTKPAGELPATDFVGHDGTIQSRTFPAFGEQDNPVTVFTAQAFEIHVEYFYGALPPDWETRSNVIEG